MIIAKKRGGGRFSRGISFSDLDGGYAIGYFNPGFYQLLVYRRGYRPQFKEEIEVKAGEVTENIDFELNPRAKRSIALEESESDSFDTLLELILDFLKEDSVKNVKEEDDFFEALTFTSLYFTLGDEEDLEEDLSRAKLTILPENVLISKDDKFEVEISLSEVSSLLGAHLELKFDPGKLSAIQISEGELLTNENGLTRFYSSIDNDQGRMTLSASRVKKGSVESGTIARIRFKAISDEPAGPIILETVELRDSLNNSVQIYGSSQVNVSKLTQGLDSVYCYPNPTKTGGITFANLPQELIRIKIFDIAGEKVLDQEVRPTDNNKWSWNLTNEKGEKVASGIYIYLLQNKSLTKKGKLAISR